MTFPSRLRSRIASLVGREGILLGAFSLIAGLLLAFGWIAEEVIEGDAAAFDARVFGWLGHSADGTGVSGSLRLKEFVRDVTALGSYAVLGYLTLAAIVYLLLIRRYAVAGLTLIAIAGGSGLSSLLKGLFGRPRPAFGEAMTVFSKSFPSSHAMLSTVAFLTLASLLSEVAPDRRTRLFLLSQAIFLSIAVGLSRIYLGVHYPSDVLAGWCLGGGWAMFWIGVAHILEPRRRRYRS